MLVDFDSLSDTARVWIYQCNRALTEGELSEIEADIKEYLSGWVSHTGASSGVLSSFAMGDLLL